MLEMIWTLWMRYWSQLCAEYERRAIIGYQETLNYSRSVAYPAAIDRAAHWNLRWQKLRTRATYPAPTERQLIVSALMRRS